MTPEQKARQLIDSHLEQSGWRVQDMRNANPMASLGVAISEYPTSTGPVDYALFVEGKPVGVIEVVKHGWSRNIKDGLEKLGEQSDILGQIFKDAINKVSHATILYRLVQMVDKGKWVSMSSEEVLR